MRTLAVLTLTAAAAFAGAGTALADGTSADNNTRTCSADHSINVLSCDDVLSDLITVQGLL